MGHYLNDMIHPDPIMCPERRAAMKRQTIRLQPMPKKNKRPLIMNHAIESLARYQMPAGIRRNLTALIKKRSEIGKSTYGTYLQPFNGRDAMRDCKEELLDAFQYAEQIEAERGEKEGWDTLFNLKYDIIRLLVNIGRAEEEIKYEARSRRGTVPVISKLHKTPSRKKATTLRKR